MNRKVLYRLYPTTKQLEKFDQIHYSFQKLYNAALEQRITVYRQQKKYISFFDQCLDLTKLRAEDPEYEALNRHACTNILKRLDLAYQSFFRRVKAGDTPGFPRFKSKERFSGWGNPVHGNGWKFLPQENRIRLSDIGSIRFRGSKHLQNQRPKTCDIILKGGRWYASITFEVPVKNRDHGSEILALDWGTSKFLTIVDHKLNESVIENPRILNQFSEKIETTQQELSRKKRGSNRRKKTKQRLNRLHTKVQNTRTDFQHKTSAALIKRSAFIVTEELSIKNLVEKSDASKGQNRSTLDTAPATFISMMRYKAEEAGIPFIEVDTRRVKPTQTCSGCGNQLKKKLGDRVHVCLKCRLILGRDENACRMMLKETTQSWEPALHAFGAKMLNNF